LASVASATAAHASAATSPRFTVPHTLPSWATPNRAHGAPSSTAKVAFSVALPLRNTDEAEQIADRVSNPASPSDGHYLTPIAFNARFGPTDAAVGKVKSYLRSQGFRVDGVAAGNRWVSATGTVAQIKHAFGISLRTYAYKGRTLRAPDRAVTLPNSLRGLVL